MPAICANTICSHESKNSVGKRGHDQNIKNEILDFKLNKYYEETCLIFPSLHDLPAPNRQASLPSVYDFEETKNEAFRPWASAELDIRVAIGHDILQELRVAAGLHNYYLRRQKDSRGLAAMKHVSEAQSSASRKKGAAVSAYTQNWLRINKLLRSGLITVDGAKTRLCGLQQIDSAQDVKFFEEPGCQTNSYLGNENVTVSWIWRVAMKGQPDIFPRNSNAMKAFTSDWESEGVSQGTCCKLSLQFSSKTTAMASLFLTN